MYDVSCSVICRSNPGLQPAGVAPRELLETPDTLARIAERVGYRSEPAFNRAFKRVVGVPPGAIRKAAGRPG